MFTLRISSTPAAALAAVALLALTPSVADAFCGFYVAGADTKLYADATNVVLLREGKRTVLSMQNNYAGPPKDFALVVPVPVVLEKENVKVLGRAVFDKVDTLAAPRLVEYWEQDPCAPGFAERGGFGRGSGGKGGGGIGLGAKSRNFGVVVKAQFEVGEYDIVILSAKDSGGLDAWLRANEYKIPNGAAGALRPYVDRGMYFFVAKVNVKKVTFDRRGQAKLSPLRFHYDADEFSLPVRLGLLNARGAQDLIVHILARNQRYEVANYPNVAIPTNLVVSDSVRRQFGDFYAALLDRTLAEKPGAVITEYAWNAASCDPCPGPTLSAADLQLLGTDVTSAAGDQSVPVPGLVSGRRSDRDWTLTRLHARYTKQDLGEDLVFQVAEPLTGGRGVPSGPQGHIRGGFRSGRSAFQGRYIILNPWTGATACQTPRRGIWGAKPGGQGAKKTTAVARNTAFAKRGKINLAKMIQATPAAAGVPAVAPTPESKPASTPAVSPAPMAEPPVAPESAQPKETPAESPAAKAPVANPAAPTSTAETGCGCATARPHALWRLWSALVRLRVR